MSNNFNIQSSSGTKTFTTAAPTTSATLLLAANGSRQSALLSNNGSQTVYVGKNSSVTTSNGVPIPAGSSLTDKSSRDAWYGITASGTGDMRICEVV